MNENVDLPLNRDAFYDNSGNQGLLPYVNSDDSLILDLGCGSGGTGQMIKRIYNGTYVTGITCSKKEVISAKKVLDECLFGNLEADSFPELMNRKYDLIILSHVLEHLVDPVAVIKRFLKYLRPHGKLIIALPNIAFWRCRLHFIQGKFDYADGGPLDRTHLKFYTFYTAPTLLIDPIPELILTNHDPYGAGVPLAFLRHSILPNKWKSAIDCYGVKLFPNLFGYQVNLVAQYVPKIG
jgi:SAM-dependent methyltransferase